jgi:hypothetical protein
MLLVERLGLTFSDRAEIATGLKGRAGYPEDRAGHQTGSVGGVAGDPAERDEDQGLPAGLR